MSDKIKVSEVSEILKMQLDGIISGCMKEVLIVLIFKTKNINEK